MALEYTNQLSLDFGRDGSGLIPVVAQDGITNEVLIVAYVNRAAFWESRRSGLATFFSRSRQEIWQKGASSGNFLKIREIRVNCEQNSLLFLVDQVGPGACHALKAAGQPYRSCFYRRLTDGGSLETIDNP